MSFTLRLLFRGLCAFVPNTVVGKPMRVLLIDGRAPGNASQQRGSLPHISHVPYVKFNLADLDQENSHNNYYIYHSSKEQTQRAMWVLNGDDLDIKVNGSPLADKELIIKTEGNEDIGLLPTMKK